MLYKPKVVSLYTHVMYTIHIYDITRILSLQTDIVYDGIQ